MRADFRHVEFQRLAAVVDCTVPPLFERSNPTQLPLILDCRLSLRASLLYDVLVAPSQRFVLLVTDLKPFRVTYAYLFNFLLAFFWRVELRKDLWIDKLASLLNHNLQSSNRAKVDSLMHSSLECCHSRFALLA